MEDTELSFSPDSYIQQNVKFLNNMFVYVSRIMAEFDKWAQRKDKTTPTTMKIIHAIYYSGCQKQNTIAKKYNLSRTTVNSNIKKMEKNGLVNLKPLTLTEKGIGLAQGIEIFFKNLVLKTEKIYGKDPHNIFKNFNADAKMVDDGFTGKNITK
jgi:predicted transcriptional regulator